MGERVLGLDRGNYAIHGTNDPSSIGRFVSHGCIRMLNQDIIDLYSRVPRRHAGVVRPCLLAAPAVAAAAVVGARQASCQQRIGDVRRAARSPRRHRPGRHICPAAHW